MHIAEKSNVSNGEDRGKIQKREMQLLHSYCGEVAMFRAVRYSMIHKKLLTMYCTHATAKTIHGLRGIKDASWTFFEFHWFLSLRTADFEYFRYTPDHFDFFFGQRVVQYPTAASSVNHTLSLGEWHDSFSARPVFNFLNENKLPCGLELGLILGFKR